MISVVAVFCFFRTYVGTAREQIMLNRVSMGGLIQVLQWPSKKYECWKIE